MYQTNIVLHGYLLGLSRKLGSKYKLRGDESDPTKVFLSCVRKASLGAVGKIALKGKGLPNRSPIHQNLAS